MSVVRADWHMPKLGVDSADPFAAVVEPSALTPLIEHEPKHESVVSADMNVDLGELAALIRAEARIEPSCPIKDRDWANPSCSACPERGSRGPLCGIGVAQERLLAA